MTISDYMSQTDIAATLLGQLGIPHSEYKFGYWTFKNGFGMIDEHGVTLYECTTEKLIRSEGDQEMTRHNYGKVILQKTFMEIRSL